LTNEENCDKIGVSGWQTDNLGKAK